MLQVPRRALPVAVALALLLAAPAAAVPPPLGELTPFPGAAGCFDATGASGCTTYAPQAAGLDLAIDAGTVYASADGALMAYRRAAAGSLTPLNCVTTAPLAPCLATDGQISGPRRIAVSPATHTLYATAGTTAATSRILAYRLAADGAIGARIGCLTETAAQGCRDVHGIAGPRDLALSGDGRRLYTAGDDAAGGLAGFDLSADGTFPQNPQVGGCVVPSGSSAAGCATGDLTLASAVAVRGSRLYAAWHGTGQNQSGVEVYTLAADGAIGARRGCAGLNGVPEPNCATTWSSLTYPQSLLVAPDGRSLLIGTGSRTVTALALDAAGDLGPRLSCEAAFPTSGCATRSGLGAVADLAVSPDGSTAYAAAGAAGIWSFPRDPATGATSGTPACIADALLGCSAFAGVGDTSAVAVAPDAARVYGNGQAVSVFQREVAPICTPTSASVAPPAVSTTLSVACADPNGDPVTYELAAAPAHGTATVSASGTAAYAPDAGFAGADAFTFRATDGSAAGSPAKVTVGVIAPSGQDPLPPAGTVVVPPTSTIDPIRSRVGARRLLRFTGRATGDGLERVEIALVRLDHGARAAARRRRAACRRLRPSGRLSRAILATAPCAAGGFLTASGTARWTFNLLRALPPGRYVLVSRARGRGGIEAAYTASAGNRRAFTVR